MVTSFYRKNLRKIVSPIDDKDDANFNDEETAEKVPVKKFV